ncbi:MAG: universal stress protein [Ectothiorhodospiraceae bacterium]|nr:universal stress protein [Chromatiales bacterium]MCP5153752.1 universal stress protein [Ectothiorhodospiraceae bacterium]
MSSYRDLVVHVDDGKSCAGRLEAAIELANRFEAHLTTVCVDPGLNVPVFVEAPVMPTLLEQLEADRAKRIESVREQVAQICDRAGIAAEWRLAEGELVSTLNLHGRYSDLVILGQEGGGDEEEAVVGGLPDSLTLELGRPVLVIPYIGVRRPPGKRVLVAWNGSREAARAVHDAMPFLVAAEHVEVVYANPREGQAGDLPGADISLHLARHGVKASAEQVVAGDVDIGDLLLSRAADADADLIVMGAYGHSRFREVVLGGVTRHLLRHMTVPVLMSH